MNKRYKAIKHPKSQFVPLPDDNQDNPIETNTKMPQKRQELDNQGLNQLTDFENQVRKERTLGEKFGEFLEKRVFWIHNVIIIAFYILIFLTIFFALISVVITLKEFLDKHDETGILKVSEHFFLSFLPIFIVFGFYNYYKNITQKTLIGNKFPSNDDRGATKTMNLTKTLFLSSIISYVMIKITEMIFFPVPNSDFAIAKILISLLLLTVLITYFIFLGFIHRD